MSTRAAAAARDEKLDLVFSALADPTRRRILARLTRGPASITEIAAPFAMTLPAVSKHLRVLERAGLMRREREGWYHRCHLETHPIESAMTFLATYRPFWEDTLEALARHVEEDIDAEAKPPAKKAPRR
jgi:DNA-binding transcriptional ArsR family regulator